MAVESVKLKRSRSSGTDEKAVSKAKRTYLVRVGVGDGPEVAEGGCPAIGAIWSVGKPGLKVVDVDSSEVEGSDRHYEVTVSYSTAAGEAVNPNPLLRGISLRLSFDGSEQEIYEAPAVPKAFDADGAEISIAGWLWKKAVVNSAGRPFDPSVTKVFRDPVVTIRKNLPTTDFASQWATFVEVMDCVNTDAFSIVYRGQTLAVPIGQAWIADLTSEPGYENGTQFEQVEISLKLRKDGWRRKIHDRGLSAFPPALSADVVNPAPRIIDSGGEFITEPVNLDGKGKKLVSGGKPVFLSWLFEKEHAFSSLPFWS
ncbi:MAG: hypothetical protein JWO31_1285 [Phycisphaerales bacterium]|nr:hypothetical protein [Phycisphaerales bacterium]